MSVLSPSVNATLEALAEAYLDAKQFVLEAGFASEIDWQEDLSFDQVTETDFLREGAWVILSSGMRETVVRGKFARLSEAFDHWRSASAIVRHQSFCRKRALCAFAHGAKVDAIIELAGRVDATGFDEVRRRVWRDGVSYLETFRYIGPVTAYHFGKNLGLDISKPDRHLVRVSQAAGFLCPDALCRVIADQVGEKLSVVDLVIWRYATLRRDYLATFSIAW